MGDLPIKKSLALVATNIEKSTDDNKVTEKKINSKLHSLRSKTAVTLKLSMFSVSVFFLCGTKRMLKGGFKKGIEVHEKIKHDDVAKAF